jgi:hypothetical protein
MSPAAPMLGVTRTLSVPAVKTESRQIALLPEAQNVTAPKDLPPPLGASDTPLYWRMNEHPKRFERLTAGVMNADPNWKNAELFGVDGQSQYGVDVTADLIDGSGRAVASSKCYREVTVANLKTFSNEFLKHREARWPDVKLFVLATAAENITDTKILDQRKAEARRFAELGIDYLVLGPEQLTDRIQLAGRPLALRHLTPAWADHLCGSDRQAELDAAQAAQIVRLQGLVSVATEARIERGFADLRAGEDAQVALVVAEARSPETWKQLQTPARSAVLRLAASLANYRHDQTEALRLASEALDLDPLERRLYALLVALGEGPEAGLAALGDPISRRDRQVRASMLIEARDLGQAAVTLETLTVEDPDDPESQRLLAHLRLLQDRRGEALTAAEQALALAPRDLSVRRTHAIALYAQAFSPLAEPLHAAAPNPSEPLLVRKSLEAQDALRAAARTFQELAELPHREDIDVLWRLACLANLPGEQAQASGVCQSLLAQDPTDLGALSWALCRALDVDVAPSLAAVAALYEAGQADPMLVRFYAGHLQAQAGSEMACAALREHLQAQTGEAREEAQARLDDWNPERPRNAIEVAVNAGLQLGQWNDAIEVLAQEMGGERPSLLGVELAEIFAKAGRWSDLRAHVEALIGFETPGPTLLALYIVHHTCGPAAVLEFLARHRGVFPPPSLSVPIRRMEIIATQNCGQLPQALALATRLVLETGEMDDKLCLARIYLASGGVQAALPLMREALLAQAITARDAIEFSVAATREDADLARALWRYAVESGVPDNRLMLAFVQANRLGSDDEAAVLMPRMHERAVSDAPDVRLFSLDDVLSLQRGYAERRRELLDLHAAGAAPIHLVASALNEPLAERYWFKGRAAWRGALAPLFLRHGGRPQGVGPKLPWRQWRVHLDITGLLVAHQLGLMEHLDALDAPVVVGRALPDALYALELQITEHQISRVAAAKAIIHAATTPRLKIQETSASEDETVRHERRRAASGLPGPTVEGVRALVHGLAPDASPAVDMSEDDMSTEPVCGSRLVFADHTLLAIAMAGDLDAALDAFDCEIPKEELAGLSEDIQRSGDREALADWIRQVKLDLSTRLVSGRFIRADHAVPAWAHEDVAPGDGGEEDAADDDDTSSPRDFVLDSLMEVLASPGDADAVLWADDRALSGYSSAEGKFVVGVVDVLDALVASEAISVQDHHRALQRLRAAGGVFIPLRADEVLAALAQATIKGGTLVETPELAVLRRNLGCALRLDSKLKVGATDVPGLEERPDELLFISETRQLMHTLLDAVWGDMALAEETAQAWSEWIWASLRVEQPIRILPDSDAGELFAALSLARLLAHAPNIASGKGAQREKRRQAYVAWVYETALQPRLGPDVPGFLDRIAELVIRFAGAASAEEIAAATGEPAERVAGALMLHARAVYNLMPEEIQRRIGARQDFALAAGFNTQPVVTLNGLMSPSPKFWAACVRALRGRTANTSALSGEVLRIERAGEALKFSGAADGGLREEFFRVLGTPAADRQPAIRSFVEGLDLAEPCRTDILRKALGAGADWRLVQILDEAADRSVVRHYGRMSDRFRSQQDIDQSTFLPPPAPDMLHHLRLDGAGGSLAERAGQAWRTLATTIGPKHAFCRLGGLPVDLAAMIAGSLAETGLAPADLGAPHTPIAGLHLAAATRRGGDDAAARGYLAGLLDAPPEQSELLRKLLTWSQRAFADDLGWWALGPAEQLAVVWAHAHRVCNMVVALDGDLAFAIRFFEEGPPAQHFNALVGHAVDIDADCADPERQTLAGLVYHGLAYIFGADDVLAAAPELAARLTALASPAELSGVIHPGIITRADEATNVMGSILQARPIGLYPPGSDPVEGRASLIESALDDLCADPADPAKWLLVSTIGRPAISPTDQNRLDAEFDQTPLAALDRSEHEMDAWTIMIDARLRLGGPIESEALAAKLHELALHLAGQFRRPVTARHDNPAARAMIALVEALGRASRDADAPAGLEKLASLFLVIADAWPGAAGELRAILDAYARAMTPKAGAPLWRALAALRAWT